MEVNGRAVAVGAGANRDLLSFLRVDLGLTGTKPGCGEGECGACTVLVNGDPVFACQTSVDDVVERSVVTVEGIASAGRLHPVQQAIIDEAASQCGYCTPGMVVRAVALLESEPRPDDRRIAEAMAPSICRCGCYPRLLGAVRRAADSNTQGDTATSPGRLAIHDFRPRHPWDRTDPLDREWFDVLGDGLVVVTPDGDAWLHVSPDGRVTAFAGKVDVGQDNTTAFRLLVAEELGVDPSMVEVVVGDTDVCPFDFGTFGSRSLLDAGPALRIAAAGARHCLAEVELRTGVRHVEMMTTEPELASATEWRVAGRALCRPDRIDAVTGARRFTSDLRRSGLRHGAVLRPPVTRARLRDVDVSPAEAMPDITVVRDGHFVGAVGRDPASARAAVSAMRATWDMPAEGPDDVVGHLRSHPVEGETWPPATDEQSGDPAGALRDNESVDATYTTAFIAHVPLETRAAVAEWDGDRLTVWTGTQVPFGVRAELASTLQIDESDVRVIVPATGSAFGGKHRGDVAIEAARLARATRCPVKVHWSRAEEFEWAYVRPMAVIDVRAAISDGGGIAAWDFVNTNAGAAGLNFPYRTDNCRLRYQPAQSPLVQGSYRALAATANTFARECHIDALARRAAVDPLEFRLRHLDDERLRAVVVAAAERFGWRDQIGPSGIAAGLEKGGRVATCAEVVVDDDGALVVRRIVTAYECGAIVNPDTVRNQIEGATVIALGGALFEQVELDHGRIANPSLSRYRVPRFTDVPAVDVVMLDRPDLPSVGAGETPVIAVAPAIANAAFAATGEARRSLPLLLRPPGPR